MITGATAIVIRLAPVVFYLIISLISRAIARSFLRAQTSIRRHLLSPCGREIKNGLKKFFFDFSCDSTIIFEGTDFNQTTLIIALRAKNQKTT
jgi:hypothetical protein